MQRLTDQVCVLFIDCTEKMDAASKLKHQGCILSMSMEKQISRLDFCAFLCIIVGSLLYYMKHLDVTAVVIWHFTNKLIKMIHNLDKHLPDKFIVLISSF